ncbi:MAG: hypothetical protein HY527_01130 [Betaproteobacteria bacterium]|nr:hypothetical protein [Betaproteobacteria bacterium]
MPAAVDEISQVVASEMNALFDEGVFSVPAAASPPATAGRETRRPTPAAARKG